MGWCRGTAIFDKVVKQIIDSNLQHAEKISIIGILIDALEDEDWDCQYESKYFNNLIIKNEFRKRHPELFEGNEE